MAHNPTSSAGNPGAQSPDPDAAPLTQQELDQKPWKYLGYKEFTRYIASDDFLALRRFDRMHCRLLLMFQDQVSELESGLDAIDARLSKRSSPDLDNGSVRHDAKERKELLERLHKRLIEYDELISHYSSLKSRPRASKTALKNMRTWLKNNNSPIHPLEAEFINNNNADLITMAGSPKSIIRRLAEQCIILPTRGLFGAVPTQSVNQHHATFRTNIHASDEHVDTLASFMIFLAATAMLIAPLWLLALVAEEPLHRLGTITGFLVLFLIILTWGTLARPFEILAATAGYSAVLVVFLQIGTITKEDGSSYFEL